MNNIYVDGELPKSCNDCKLGYFYDCQYCFLRPDLAEKDEWCEKEKHCKLLPLSDRLAEERKKVVQELRERAKNEFEFIICDECYNTVDKDVYISSVALTEILYQIERGE